MFRLAIILGFLLLFIGGSIRMMLLSSDSGEMIYIAAPDVISTTTVALESNKERTTQAEHEKVSTTTLSITPSEKHASISRVNTEIDAEVASPPKPPLSPEVLNEMGRSALVNILCEGEAPLRSTSGSGVIVDPRGIILTNAHVAQYFLLEAAEISARCVIRTGSPARSTWSAKLAFLPSQWVEKHAGDILKTQTIGTGEDDYAFLAITDAFDGPLPASFPYVPLDFEEVAVVPGDNVLLAGYPAEFIGGRAARDTLFASTVFTTIKQILTFDTETVDVISVDGTALAQSGSSGGGFISMTGSLVGIVVTTSRGETTGQRTLHAITPTHIDRSVRSHAGFSVRDLLTSSPQTLVATFAAENFPKLSTMLTNAISQAQN